MSKYTKSLKDKIYFTKREFYLIYLFFFTKNPHSIYFMEFYMQVAFSMQKIQRLNI